MYANIYITYDDSEQLEKPELQDELRLIGLAVESLSFFKVTSDLTEVCEIFLVMAVTL